MESKRTTLRSQTVQCPHCGEYYSVTYSHCPFCSEGRREAEEEKQSSFLGGLFGGKKSAEKKSSGKKGKSGKTPENHPERPEHTRAEAQRPARKSAGDKDGHLSGPRKRISEMTPEERAAFDEDRKIRAEMRKRERERKAREEARLNGGGMIDVEGPTETETVPIAGEPKKSGGMEQEFIILRPGGAKAASAPETAESVPVPSAGTESVELEIPTETAPATAPETVPETASPEPPAPAPAATPVQESPVQEPPVQPEPVSEPSIPSETKAEKVETDEDLDDLLNEIREMISRSPVPQLSREQIAAKAGETPEPTAPVAEEPPVEVRPETEQPAAPVAEEPPAAAQPETEQPAAPVAEETPAAAQPETEQPAAPVTEETPAEVQSETEPAGETPGEPTPAAEEPDDTMVFPGGPLPVGEVKDNGDHSSTATKKAPADTTKKSREKRSRKESKKKGKPPILLILSLVIVIVAAVILVKYVVPTFKTGILSGGGDTAVSEVQAVEGGAQTFTLDRTEVTMAEKGASVTLIPTFAPEGTTGVLTWASSDPAIATVDAAGLVTSVAPGVVTITAALPNGQTGICTVTCDWQVEQGPTLSTGAVTLDGAGKTVQVTVNGATGTAAWSSDKPEVASVTSDGTVTAVAKGSATITAKVDGKELTCKVDCIW